MDDIAMRAFAVDAVVRLRAGEPNLSVEFTVLPEARKVYEFLCERSRPWWDAQKGSSVEPDLDALAEDDEGWEGSTPPAEEMTPRTNITFGVNYGVLGPLDVLDAAVAAQVKPES